MHVVEDEHHRAGQLSHRVDQVGRQVIAGFAAARDKRRAKRRAAGRQGGGHAGPEARWVPVPLVQAEPGDTPGPGTGGRPPGARDGLAGARRCRDHRHRALHGLLDQRGQAFPVNHVGSGHRRAELAIKERRLHRHGIITGNGCQLRHASHLLLPPTRRFSTPPVSSVVIPTRSVIEMTGNW